VNIDISLLAEALSFVIPDEKKREPLPIRDALFEMPPSTTVDEQNQFISGLT